MFTVKEIFYTLQGEGHSAGRAAVFCRFAGCNLWTGLERDRNQGGCAAWCDTDFVGGNRYTDEQLLNEIQSLWPGGGRPMIVFTGGEPSLQLTEVLLSMARVRGFDVEVETNGIRELPSGTYWVTVSPKPRTKWRQHGHALKVVWPQDFNLAELEQLDFREFYLQPMDGPMLKENTEAATRECLARPQWRLSLQTHKFLGLR